jgi:hypothetical protein
MYINEALANGLKDRLWTECEDMNARTGQLFMEYRKKHKT